MRRMNVWNNLAAKMLRKVLRDPRPHAQPRRQPRLLEVQAQVCLHPLQASRREARNNTQSAWSRPPANADANQLDSRPRGDRLLPTSRSRSSGNRPRSSRRRVSPDDLDSNAHGDPHGRDEEGGGSNDCKGWGDKRPGTATTRRVLFYSVCLG